jgi:hypothetical protein
MSFLSYLKSMPGFHLCGFRRLARIAYEDANKEIEVQVPAVGR